MGLSSRAYGLAASGIHLFTHDAAAAAEMVSSLSLPSC
jgi:hypothetical protein